MRGKQLGTGRVHGRKGTVDIYEDMDTDSYLYCLTGRDEWLHVLAARVMFIKHVP